MPQTSDDELRARLRLVLGVGRSGTTWIARILGHTSTPTQLLQEPLFQFRPRLRLSPGADHMAIGATARLPDRHRLLTAYRCLLQESQSLRRIGVGDCIERDDAFPQTCVVKEVHGLLATEAIIRGLGCPTALVLRDPVMTVDSILRTNGFHTIYLQAESQYLLERASEREISPDFGRLQSAARRLCESARRRQRTVLRLVFAVASIHLLFRRLDAQHECVRLVRYEDLCGSGHARFRDLASEWNLHWDATADRYLSECSAPPHTTSPYETRRVAKQQLARPPAVLRPRDVAVCQRLLELSGYHAGRPQASRNAA